MEITKLYQMPYSSCVIARDSRVTNISFLLFIQFILLHLFHFEKTEVSLLNMAILFSVKSYIFFSDGKAGFFSSHGISNDLFPNLITYSMTCASIFSNIR